MGLLALPVRGTLQSTISHPVLIQMKNNNRERNIGYAGSNLIFRKIGARKEQWDVTISNIETAATPSDPPQHSLMTAIQAMRPLTKNTWQLT